MKMLDPHGLTITGLCEIAEATKALKGETDSAYYQLNYNMATGKAWIDAHNDPAHTSWTAYEDDGVYLIGLLDEPMTERQLADIICGNVILADADGIFLAQNGGKNQ